MRRQVFSKCDLSSAQVANLSYAQTLDYCVQQHYINASIKSALETLDNALVDHIENGGSTTTTIALLGSMETTLKAGNRPAAEKNYLLLQYNIAKQLTSYLEQNGSGFQGDAVSDRDPAWWKCYKKSIWKWTKIGFLIGSISGAITGLDAALSSPSNPGTGPTPGGGFQISGVDIIVVLAFTGAFAVPGAGIGAVVGAIVGLFTADDCAFSANCQSPTSIGLTFTNCSSADVTPGGFGSSATAFIWTLGNATPVSAVTTIASPTLKNVTPIDPTLPVGFAISSTCVDNNQTNMSLPNDFSADFSLFSKLAGDFFIGGPLLVHNDEPEEYEPYGPDANSTVHEFSFVVMNGTIVSSNAQTGHVKVLWSDVNAQNDGRLRIISKNTCPQGTTKSREIKVTFDPDPN